VLAKHGPSEDGGAAIEYGIIASLIAIAIIDAVTLVGGNLNSRFTEASANLR